MTARVAVKPVAVIGGGPAGLMAAEILIRGGLKVDLYEAMPSVGRKFLMAGKGGMNISHSEPFDLFLSRYGARSQRLKPVLEAFGPIALRDWVHELGIGTFVGSSGRVFPTGMKAAPLLRAWLHRLRQTGVHFHMRHRWLGWLDDDAAAGKLRFETPEGEITVCSEAVVLALGGGSWARLGSNGAWVSYLRRQGISVAPLRPSNCGFDAVWSKHFKEAFAGEPLKPVSAFFTDSAGISYRRQGEFNVTENGVEGGLIYALSAPLREEIAGAGHVDLFLDLAPEVEQSSLYKKLSGPRGKNTWANHLRKKTGIKGVKTALLRELLSTEEFNDLAELARKIKALPVRLIAPRPLDEAISSAGGVIFEALDEHLMARAKPGVFCAGEMLDWEAPTGGYLLTACFASGYVAGSGVLNWIEQT